MTTPWHDHPLARELDVALAAVREAGLLCREVQAAIDPGAMQTKDKSPVTVADYGSQALVCRALAAAFPADPVIGEEDSAELRAAANAPLLAQVVERVRERAAGAGVDDICAWIDRGNAHEHSPRFWTLDPIDGTKGFLRGGQYAVSLAWIENGAAVMGFLGCPNMSKDFNRPFDDPDPHGVVYFAGAGEGLYETASDDPRESPLHLRRLQREPDEPLRLCESVDGSHTSHDAAGRIMERLGDMAEPSRLDGQGKYAVVARGQADVYMRLPKKSGYIERIWDHAAGAVIAMEAGLSVTDVDGEPLDFGCGRGMDKNRGIVVAEPALHGRLMRIIQELSLFDA